MAPTHERLNAHQLAVAEIELRLVDHVQFVGVDGGAEIREELQPLKSVDVELRGVQADAVALELRVIQRDVHVLHEGVGVVTVVWGDGDARARPHEQLEALDVNWSVKRAEEVARGGCRVQHVAEHHDSELVAAEAVDGRVLRRGGRELVGDLAQDEVAERVTEGVVDVLEVVKVE